MGLDRADGRFPFASQGLRVVRDPMRQAMRVAHVFNHEVTGPTPVTGPNQTNVRS